LRKPKIKSTIYHLRTITTSPHKHKRAKQT
jgi:hypothetical protein